MANNQYQEPMEHDAPAGEEDYEHLLEDYSHFAPPSQGEILQGTVLKVTAKEVIVDFGYKSEGLAPIEQFVGPDGTVNVQPGDVIDVMIDHGERPRRLRPAVARKGGPHPDLGQSRAGHSSSS